MRPWAAAGAGASVGVGRVGFPGRPGKLPPGGRYFGPPPPELPASPVRFGAASSRVRPGRGRRPGSCGRCGRRTARSWARSSTMTSQSSSRSAPVISRALASWVPPSWATADELALLDRGADVDHPHRGLELAEVGAGDQVAALVGHAQQRRRARHPGLAALHRQHQVGQTGDVEDRHAALADLLDELVGRRDLGQQLGHPRDGTDADGERGHHRELHDRSLGSNGPPQTATLVTWFRDARWRSLLNHRMNQARALVIASSSSGESWVSLVQPATFLA